ncbi:hypothetical protein HAX54_047112 [Datura stramonium]|uniref:Uncharacterized protein n=1 Tax=Datura stramonium TaxID=4076 RepID=A0ABS8WMN2_DATST|nr:hypothetical protein [Datura stramonium]
MREKKKKQKQVKPPTEDLDVRSKVGSHFSESSRKTQKRRKTSDSGWAYTGTVSCEKEWPSIVKLTKKLEGKSASTVLSAKGSKTKEPVQEHGELRPEAC